MSCSFRHSSHFHFHIAITFINPPAARMDSRSLHSHRRGLRAPAVFLAQLPGREVVMIRCLRRLWRTIVSNWFVEWRNGGSRPRRTSCTSSRTKFINASYPFSVPVTAHTPSAESFPNCLALLQNSTPQPLLGHIITSIPILGYKIYAPSRPPLNFTVILLSIYFPKSKIFSFLGLSCPCCALPPRPGPPPPRPPR